MQSLMEYLEGCLKARARRTARRRMGRGRRFMKFEGPVEADLSNPTDPMDLEESPNVTGGMPILRSRIPVLVMGSGVVRREK